MALPPPAAPAPSAPPPMPPGGGGGAPAPGPMGAGGPPPEAQAEVERIMGDMPEPVDAYTIKYVERLYESLEEAWEAVREAVPDLPALPPKEQILPPDYDGTGPLPQSLIVPLVLLLQLGEQLTGNKRYKADLSALDKDAGLERMAAVLDVLEKDKAIAKATKGASKMARGEKDMDEGAEDEAEAAEEVAGPPPGVRAGLMKR